MNGNGYVSFTITVDLLYIRRTSSDAGLLLVARWGDRDQLSNNEVFKDYTLCHGTKLSE